MKVNGNKKNGKSLGTDDPKTDQLSKKAVAVVDEIPLKSFDSSKAWRKITIRLGKMDKGLVTWGLAMAASFSLLVAANLEILDWQQPTPKYETTEIERTPLDRPNVSLSFVKPISNPRLIETKQPESPDIPEPSSQYLARESHPQTVLLNKGETESLEVSRLSNPFVSVFGKINVGSEALVPEIGIDFKLAENYTAKRREIYKLGVSSQFNFKTKETGERQIHPHTFVNFEFTSLNKKTSKGWTSRAGYLLNPDGQLYQDTTIKVSLLRNVNKHIKIGPEVIFTNNMKQAYPSISLILG